MEGPPSTNPWIRAFCCVTFDVDKGQVLEECFPAGEVRASRERMDFLAFLRNRHQDQGNLLELAHCLLLTMRDQSYFSRVAVV